MKRNDVESSMFKSVGYDPATEMLELEFLNGNVYEYSGFSKQDWNDFCAAKSKGAYFGKYVRGRFAHVRKLTVHGVDCPKLPHTHPDLISYGHEAEFDGPFELEGVKLCGRCHAMLP